MQKKIYLPVINSEDSVELEPLEMLTFGLYWTDVKNLE